MRSGRCWFSGLLRFSEGEDLLQSGILAVCVYIIGVYVCVYMYVCMYVYICLCACICVYVCVHVYMYICLGFFVCVYKLVCGEQMFLNCYQKQKQKQGLSVAWASPSRLVWLARKPQDCIPLHLPNTEIRGLHQDTWLL